MVATTVVVVHADFLLTVHFVVEADMVVVVGVSDVADTLFHVGVVTVSVVMSRAKSVSRIISTSKGLIPLTLNPLVAISTLAAFPYASENSSISREVIFLLTCARIHLQHAVLYPDFRDLKKVRSSGCSLYEVCGGMDNMTMAFSRSNSTNVRDFVCVLCPSRIRRALLVGEQLTCIRKCWRY